MIRRMLARRRPPAYECLHGIEWAYAWAAAYCDCPPEQERVAS